MLDDEDLDPATELSVREQLEALRDPDLSEDEQRKRWERVKSAAPGLWEKSGARAILESVVSTAIRQQLGLELAAAGYGSSNATGSGTGWHRRRLDDRPAVPGRRSHSPVGVLAVGGRGGPSAC